MSNKLKAYIVREDHEGCCAVVFADRNVVARRYGANELNLEFEEVESCKRAPQFDSFADQGFVPVRAMIEAGWWYECHGCYRRVGYDCDDDDEELGPIDPVYSDHAVWCTQQCLDNEQAERDAKKALAAQAIQQCQELFPFGTDFHCNPYAWKRQREIPFVTFNFPGGQGHAEWEMGDELVYIQQRDLGAWRLLRPEKEGGES